MIVYDCEIIKAIPPKNGERVEGIEYCDGWDDLERMGISVICAYDYASDRYRVFCKDNFAEFQELMDSADIVVGYNSLKFDNQLCRANGLNAPDDKSFDLLIEIWKAHGLGPVFEHPSHLGYGLDAVAKANLKTGKTNSGALAPVAWQQGKIGEVIDYCLEDVRLTRLLFDYVLDGRKLISPVTGDPFQITWPEIKETAV